jgi:hypothetical protein
MASGRLTVAYLVVLVASCLGQNRPDVDIRTGLPILQIFEQRTKTSGSLEYLARCDGSADFPRIHAPLKGGSSPVEVLREMFSEDPMMRVTQERTGNIRMVEAGVPNDLLDVKIKHISFSFEANGSEMLNSPYVALHFILAAPEVRTFMRSQKIGPSEEDTFELPGATGSGQSRVLGDLDNVTVSEALDHVVQAYPGFWIYKNCQGKDGSRKVFFSFF